MVWRLDRLGRSLRDLIGWMTYLEEEKVGLLSLHEAIDRARRRDAQPGIPRWAPSGKDDVVVGAMPAGAAVSARLFADPDPFAELAFEMPPQARFASGELRLPART